MYNKWRRHTCNCRSCKRHAFYKLVLANGSRQQIRRMFDDIVDCLLHAEDDLNYHQCILDGSWPTAVKQLEEALANAKKMRDEHPEDFPLERAERGKYAERAKAGELKFEKDPNYEENSRIAQEEADLAGHG
jgi:hypothetical protein